MQRRNAFAVGSALLAGGMMAAGLPASARAVAGRSGGLAPIPDIEVQDHEGRHFRFYTDLVRGRVVMINFFFTSCGEVCPLVSENLRTVQDLLGDRMGRDIFMYSISLQPELETPAILKDYASVWDVRPGWHFLTGKPADIERLRRSLGFASSDPDYDLVKDNHTGMLRYGNDRLNRWAATPGLARPAWIAKAVTSIAGRA